MTLSVAPHFSEALQFALGLAEQTRRRTVVARSPQRKATALVKKGSSSTVGVQQTVKQTDNATLWARASFASVLCSSGILRSSVRTLQQQLQQGSLRNGTPPTPLGCSPHSPPGVKTDKDKAGTEGGKKEGRKGGAPTNQRGHRLPSVDRIK